MQENPGQPPSQSPQDPQQFPQLPPRSSPPEHARLQEVNSPRSGAVSGVGVAGGSGPENQMQSGYTLHRGSSSESVADSNICSIPVKYRSSAGSFEEHIAFGFANLHSSSELSDVTIACEGKFLKAHKLVLAISSPYFRQIFEELHEFPCQHPVVILHGIKLRDWENIMRLIYHGIVYVSSDEIDDFISTAECLKIDGIISDESSTHDATPPYEYVSRYPDPEFSSQEEHFQVRCARSTDPKHRMYSTYSPDPYSSSKDYRFDQGPEPHDPGSIDGESDAEQLALVRYRKTPRAETGGSRGISSAQSSPGIPMGTHSSSRENLLKMEPYGGLYQGSDSGIDTHRPPSCPEGFRVCSQPPSPIESRILAVRHPVISRRRDTSTESAGDDVFPAHTTNSEFMPSARMVITPRLSRPLHYQPSSGWDPRTVSEPMVIEDTDRQFPTVISRSPRTSTTSTGHGVATRYPLSVISRQPPTSMPLQLINPTQFLQRMPQLPLLSPSHRSPQGDPLISPPGVITTVPSPHSLSQGHDQPSTLAILRAKIAAGQQIYSRGYRHDRIQSHSIPFGMPRFPSAALGSASQLQLRENESIPGPSRTIPNNLFGSPTISPHPPQPVARPKTNYSIISSSMIQSGQMSSSKKTKAIRSSQVPQSARYTAAEVDAMVEKVQNFPGNMVPCAICHKFVKRERLRAHIHECHLLNGKRIVCPHCGIGLKSKGSYRVHIWRHKRGALPNRQQRNQLGPPHAGS